MLNTYLSKYVHNVQLKMKSVFNYHDSSRVTVGNNNLRKYFTKRTHQLLPVTNFILNIYFYQLPA